MKVLLKSVAGAFLCYISFFLFMPALAYGNEAVEKLVQDSPGEWRWGRVAAINAGPGCRLTEGYLDWPVISCEGYLTFRRTSYVSEYNHLVYPDENDFKVETSDGRLIKWERERTNFLSYISDKESPEVMVFNNRVELVGLYDYIRTSEEDYRQYRNRDLLVKRLEYVGVVLGLFLLSIVAAMVSYWAYKFVRTGKLKLAFRKTLRAYDNRKIRNLAVSESVKHSVRESFDKGKVKEKDDLKRQIADAVESGDTELARSLAGLLRSMDNK